MSNPQFREVNVSKSRTQEFLDAAKARGNPTEKLETHRALLWATLLYSQREMASASSPAAAAVKSAGGIGSIARVR